jgi:hypothetical protein
MLWEPRVIDLAQSAGVRVLDIEMSEGLPEDGGL